MVYAARWGWAHCVVVYAARRGRKGGCPAGICAVLLPVPAAGHPWPALGIPPCIPDGSDRCRDLRRKAKPQRPGCAACPYDQERCSRDALDLRSEAENVRSPSRAQGVCGEPAMDGRRPADGSRTRRRPAQHTPCARDGQRAPPRRNRPAPRPPRHRVNAQVARYRAPVWSKGRELRPRSELQLLYRAGGYRDGGTAWRSAASWASKLRSAASAYAMQPIGLDAEGSVKFRPLAPGCGVSKRSQGRARTTSKLRR